VSLCLCDTSVWLALALPDHVHHRIARAWFDEINEVASIGFCRSTQQSFLRLLTVPTIARLYGSEPIRNEDAWHVYESLLADDRVTFYAEPAGLEPHWQTFSARNTSSGALWMDAYLAAFAVSIGCELVTLDAGFKQFAGLDLLLLPPG
jgi:uncharacterized protein